MARKFDKSAKRKDFDDYEGYSGSLDGTFYDDTIPVADTDGLLDVRYNRPLKDTSSSAQLAKAEGVPAVIDLVKMRYSYCDANCALLTIREGNYYIYQGDCTNRHFYRVRYNKKKDQHEGAEKLSISGDGIGVKSTAHKITELSEF